jgi:putative ATPase
LKLASTLKDKNSNFFESLQVPRIEPLAARMRPKNLDEYIGQQHILSEGRLLRRAILSDQLSSLIFYGPPGTGKTTLAQVIARHTKSHFMSLNAVLSGLANIRESIQEAKQHFALQAQKSILFIDEVHRFNKSQQDALLPHVENGTIILIGATTENPYFEVNKALVSRSRIFELQSLKEQDLNEVFERALRDPVRGYGQYQVTFEEDAKHHLIQTCNGDARSLLNAIELAIEPEIKSGKTKLHISLNEAEESIQKRAILYDKDGDAHYDIISAFIKSIRGSDPDAALYWMAKMLQGGEDPRFIFRRMLISASEDIGLAKPDCLNIVVNCSRAYDYVGMPEGRYHLTHACLTLCNAPKSNSTMGFFDAIQAVTQSNDDKDSVPNHLRDKSRDGKDLGHGKGYQYPHAYQDHWVAQQYLPNHLSDKVFYHPSKQGDEKVVYDQVHRRRELTWSVLLEKQHQAVSHTHTDHPHEWQQQSLDNFEKQMRWCRELLLDKADINRSDLVLDIHASTGLITLEACRQIVEGGVHAITWSEEEADTLEKLAQNLDDFERPKLHHGSTSELVPESLNGICFDKIFSRHVWDRGVDIATLFRDLDCLSHERSLFISYDYLFQEEQRLSETLLSLLPKSKHPELDLLKNLENDYLQSSFLRRKFQREDLQQLQLNWTCLEQHVHPVTLKKYFNADMIDKWFSTNSPFGSSWTQSKTLN